MSALALDIRLAFRLVLQRPWFSAAVILALGLCIGANTAMFSVVHAILWKQLPFRDPNRLVYLSERVATVMSGPIPFSAPDLEEVIRRNHSLSEAGAYRGKSFEVSNVGKPEWMGGARVSASLFPLLGLEPVIGRNFTAPEDRDGRHVVILSNSFWRTKFNSDPHVLGRKLVLDRIPFTIVGVLPPGLVFPPRGPKFNSGPAAFYVPMSFTKEELAGFGDMYNHSVVARLRPGVTLQQANAELSALAHQIASDLYPSALKSLVAKLDISAVPLHDEIVGNMRLILLLLLSAVGLVLLVGCADVAGLLLTRAAGREREMSVRTAIGASRFQLLRQVLVEGAVLALLGGACGLLLCYWFGSALVDLTGLEPNSPITIDSNVLLFTVTVSLVSALLFGLVPALRSSQVNVNLREGGRTQTGGPRHGRLLNSLVITQFALALLLLIGAGLLLRSFNNLIATDPGFSPDHTLALTVSLPNESYSSASSIRNFYTRLDQQLQSLPGIKAAGLATSLPLGINEHRRFAIDGQPATPGSVPRRTSHIWVSGDFFPTLRIPLQRGRYLDRRDIRESLPVIVISEALAHTFWGGADPIGKRLKWGGDNSKSPWMTVVGVVHNVKADTMNEPATPETYSPWQQVPDENLVDKVTGEYRTLDIVVRTENAPSSQIAAIERTVHSLDPSLPLSHVVTMTAEVNASLRAQQLQTALLAGFAGAALLLAALGIGGVLAYSVAQRTPEIGVRIALGARSADILRMIFLRGMALAAIGSALGLVAAALVTRFVTQALYKVSPYDLPTYAGATLFLVLTACLAVFLPARKAMSVDPIQALRNE